MVRTSWTRLVSGWYRSSEQASQPISSCATPTMMRAASSVVRAALSRRLTSKKAARWRSARPCSADFQPLGMALPIALLDLRGRRGMQPQAPHPAAIHLHHLEGVGADRHAIARARQPPELTEDVAADGGVIRIVEGGVVLGVELGDRHRPVEARGAVGGARPVLPIVLVEDGADDLFEQILHRDQAGGTAVLVEHHGEMGLESLHV